MTKIATRLIHHGVVRDGKNEVLVFEPGAEVKGLSDADLDALGSAVADAPAAKPKDAKSRDEK